MDELKNFGDLKPGDVLLGSNGQPVTVVKAYDEHIPESMWEIELEDGSLIKASGNHLWYCETRLDWELHALRKRTAKKFLKNVTPQAIALLEESAAKENPVETRLVDMVTLLQAASSQDFVNVIERVADAIGHVSENTMVFEDLNGDGDEEESIRTYDARLFAQQLLKLTGRRKYKHYRLIVGSIMTTDAMMELGETVEIPVTNPL
jgi:hypothetical protein